MLPYLEEGKHAHPHHFLLCFDLQAFWSIRGTSVVLNIYPAQAMSVTHA